MIRTCSPEIPTFVSHSVPIPRCCPVSGNPAPGSSIRLSYKPLGVVFPVEDLTSMVAEYVDGHADRDVRNMEEMIQDLAVRAATVTGVSVRVVADLRIDPPYGGDQQTMRVAARATA